MPGMSRVRYERLATERVNPAARDLDRLEARAIVTLMNREDERTVSAVRRAIPEVTRAVELIAGALGRGGRLFFAGAGTSGRLGVLEAAECPPTFGTPPRVVQAIMAGGRASVFRSREGAEDDAAEAGRRVRALVRAGDVLVGVSASAVTPFVRAALAAARGAGARTVLVACDPGAPRRLASVVVGLSPGPEVVAGSTRLKAGTTTKMVLNMLTTAAMVRLGKVLGNRMVDLQPRSRKLTERAVRLIEEVALVPRGRARRALAEAGGRVRVAIVAAAADVGAAEARRLLRRHGGALRAVLAAVAGKYPPAIPGGVVTSKGRLSRLSK